MATNGAKKFSVELTPAEALMIANACSMAQAAVKRAVAKEVDPVIVERRNKAISELQEISNRVMYGGKEIV